MLGIHALNRSPQWVYSLVSEGGNTFRPWHPGRYKAGPAYLVLYLCHPGPCMLNPRLQTGTWPPPVTATETFSSDGVTGEKDWHYLAVQEPEAEGEEEEQGCLLAQQMPAKSPSKVGRNHPISAWGHSFSHLVFWRRTVLCPETAPRGQRIPSNQTVHLYMSMFLQKSAPD